MIVIRDKRNCCGCGGCVTVCPVNCIAFHEDAEGFLYPAADQEKCIDCGRCDAACPMLNPLPKRAPLHFYAAKNLDGHTRAQSSSGGIFSLLAQRTIEAGGAVFGARFDDDWSVAHDMVESMTELPSLHGSKYVQSRMGDNYSRAEKLLKEGREVLFSGTSCQIAGLRHYLGRDYDNLTAVDVVCHSVPSPKVWKRYLEEVAATAGGGCAADITSVNFRDKSRGWKTFSVVIRGVRPGETQDSVLLSDANRDNAYIKGFISGLFMRPSCTRCPAKGFSAGSDLTIADFWGADKHYPEFDDNKGITLVAVLTERGERIFSELGAEHIAVRPAEVYPKNPRIMKPMPANRKRDSFFAEMDSRPIAELALKLTRRPLLKRLSKRIRKFLKRKK